MQNKEVQFVDIGLTDYQETWDLQEKLLDHIAQIKLRNRR